MKRIEEQRASLHAPPFLAAWSIAALSLWGVSLVPAIPYNVHELFERWPAPVAAALLAGVTLFAFSIPAWLSLRLQSDPSRGLRQTPPAILVHALLTYLFLRLSVPLESIHDIVGNPVLTWPGELERALRFAALFGWVDLMLIGGALLFNGLRSGRFRPFGAWTLLAVLLVPLCYWVVVDQAATDNLVELLTTGAKGGYGLFLSLWLLLVAVGGSAMGARLGGSFGQTGALLVLLALTLAAGFLSINLAMNPRVYKYGQVFSGLSFLLSTDRNHYAQGGELLIRYLAGHLGMVLLLGLSQYPVFHRGNSSSRREKGTRPIPSPSKALPSTNVATSRTNALPRKKKPRWFWPALFLGYLFFVIYGSLVPLDFHPRPWNEAWRAFLQIRYLQLGIGSRADWVANILLFIPLTFFGCALFRRFSKCSPVKYILMLGFAVVLASMIEFTQLFFPQRTVSLNDLVAEFLGAAAGLLLWGWRGEKIVAWAEGFHQAVEGSQLAEYLLRAYLAVVFIYGVLPLDLTLSPVEIYHKWKNGQLVLIPFGFHVGSPVEWAYALATDTLLWVPVGLLLVLSRNLSLLKSWAVTTALALLLETMQLFVYSRVTDVTDVFTATLGGLLGARMGTRLLSHGFSTKTASSFLEHRRCPAIACAALLGWCGVLLAIFWYPFDFRLQPSFINEKLTGFFRIPFLSYYYGTEYRAVTELIHKVAFFMPLGGLAALGMSCHRKELRGTACLTPVLIWPLAVEVGQLALPEKIAGSTDLVLEFIGIAVGYWLTRRIHGAWRRATDAAPLPHSKMSIRASATAQDSSWNDQ